MGAIKFANIEELNKWLFGEKNILLQST